MKYITLIFKLCVFLLLIIQIDSNEDVTSPNIAVIPFKIFYYPKQESRYIPKEYLDNIHSSLPYLEIEIGKDIKKKSLTKEQESRIPNKKQYLSIFIIIDDYSFYIDDNYFYSEEKKPLCRYSTELSSSYEINPLRNIAQDKKSSVIGTDYVKIFSDTALSKYDMVKIEFKYNYDKTNNISFACGKAGLLTPSNKLYIDTDINFSYQMHTNLDNIDYSFMIKFNNNNNQEKKSYEGLVIFGIESFEKKKNEELISIYTKPGKYGSKFEWRFDMDQITIGNIFYEFNQEEFVIVDQIEGIEIPYSFYDKLNKEFFKSYYQNKICQTDIVNNFYIVIYCNSEMFTEKDIKKFPTIKFLKYKIGYNFTFTGEELFYFKNNTYIFKMISYLEKYKTDFKLGRMFLKKYKVIFNSDSKSMLFYRNNDEKKEGDVMNNTTEAKNNVTLIVFSYIFIGLLFLGAGIYFGRKFCIMRRKIYANELEDDNYAYVSKNKDVKKERKLIEL